MSRQEINRLVDLLEFYRRYVCLFGDRFGWVNAREETAAIEQALAFLGIENRRKVN